MNESSKGGEYQKPINEEPKKSSDRKEGVPVEEPSQEQLMRDELFRLSEVEVDPAKSRENLLNGLQCVEGRIIEHKNKLVGVQYTYDDIVPVDLKSERDRDEVVRVLATGGSPVFDDEINEVHHYIGADAGVSTFIGDKEICSEVHLIDYSKVDENGDPDQRHIYYVITAPWYPSSERKKSVVTFEDYEFFKRIMLLLKIMNMSFRNLPVKHELPEEIERAVEKLNKKKKDNFEDET